MERRKEGNSMKPQDNDTHDFKDILLHCVDCDKDFVFEAGEQFFFWSKDLPQPKRCPDCRRIRRATLKTNRELRGGI